MIKAVDAQNAACNAVVQLVDHGSLNPSGSLTLLDASSTLIASFILSNPAFLPAVDGTSVSNYITDSTSVVDGTAYVFNILDRDTSVVWSGTVSDFAGTGDLKLNSISIPQDSTISLTQIVYSVPEYFVNIGNQGVTGVQGPFGITGVTGAGIQGTTGVQGLIGFGYQGYTGAQGNQGNDGATGIQGLTGIQGTTGAGIQGIQGNNGVTGVQGPLGNTGIQGPTGIQGNQGITGPSAGPQGLTGVQGNDGDQGLTGVQGNQGLTGLQGYTGVQGNNGIIGATGVGADGNQGMTGVQGLTGVQGITGAFGGPPGVTGVQGVMGPQGLTGIFVGNFGEISGMVSYEIEAGLYTQLVGGAPGFLYGMTVDSSSHLIIGTEGIYLASYFLMGQTQTTPDNISCEVFVDGTGQATTFSETWYSTTTEGIYASQSKSMFLHLNSDDTVDLRISGAHTQGMILSGTHLTLLQVG